jgi:2-C-methyl-D-erythritol 4-phosphate cytidylyltransferase
MDRRCKVCEGNERRIQDAGQKSYFVIDGRILLKWALNK